MGYYTYYSLEIIEDNRPKRINAPQSAVDKALDPYGEEQWNDGEEDDLIAVLRANNEEAAYAFNDDGRSEDGTKWYDYRQDMIEFSKRFPDVLFRLHGEGEEGGDLWDEYYKNGQYQHCPVRMEYDDFDENKLITPKKDKYGRVI